MATRHAPPADSDHLLSAAFLRKLESLSLVTRRMASGRERGERRSSLAGSGVAFATHRPYAPGDDLRFLDWRALARTERLVSKQFEQGSDLTVSLLLDCSASMSHGGTFAYAKQLCAALGYVALVNLDAVAVAPYASEPRRMLRAQRGRTRALVLLRFLAALEAHGGTDLASCARRLLAHVRRGLALVVTDGFDHAATLRGVDILRAARLEPVVFLLNDSADEAIHGEVSMTDAETGEQVAVYVDAHARARYHEASRAHTAALVREFALREVRAVSLEVGTPIEHAVLDLSRRGGIVS